MNETSGQVLHSGSRLPAPSWSYLKLVSWCAFGLMTVAALLFSSLPVLERTHPLHDLLYSQRWLLAPHIAGGLTALIIGPLQFSNRLRRGNVARHRLLGYTYIASVCIAATTAVLMSLNYPAYFPYSNATNAFVWVVNTGAAFLTARKGHTEQHRRWMARSYAMVSTFVLPRVPIQIPAYNNMSLEASSYSLLIFSLLALLIADLIVDWRVMTESRATG